MGNVNMGKVLIELFTLDSAGCAACTYTKESADRVAGMMREQGYDIEVAEFPVKSKENVKLMRERGVTAIPTICINGDIVFESILPQDEEFIEEIKKRM